jgi:hypothetical protein
MRLVKRLGLAVFAVCALSAIAVSSASASPTFLAHLWTKILLLAEAKSAQLFNAPGAGAPVSCTKTKLLPPDTAPTLQFLSILVTVDYESCTVASTFPATVNPIRYVLDANGLTRLENTVLISAPTLGCTITIPSAKNQSLNTIKYNNLTDGSLLLLAKVKGITSFGEGAGCTFAEESNGEYTGNIRVFADGPAGSVIRWDP